MRKEEFYILELDEEFIIISITDRGAQVVTLTEMMGTFLNLVGAVRTLLLAVAVVAVAVSLLSVFNTLLDEMRGPRPGTSSEDK